MLNPALVRPGQLAVQLYVCFPNESERQAILDVHMSRVHFADDVDAKSLSQDDSVTDGMSGADLVAFVHEGACFAMKEDFEVARIVHSRQRHVAAQRVRPRNATRGVDLLQSLSKGIVSTDRFSRHLP